MATVVLKEYPKELNDKVESLTTRLRTTNEILLSAIVLYAMDNQPRFSATPPYEIDIRNEIMLHEISFPVGLRDGKKKILDWGKKHGRKQYHLQILFIVTRFFEHGLTLPDEYLGKATSLR